MKTKLLVIAGILLFFAVGAYAQGGGKAEPNRIKFAKGKLSAAMTRTLSNNQEMEYIFGAKAGQLVKLKVVSVPKGNLFSFSIDGANGIELETEYDSYADYTFTAPETGDYLITVTKRPTAKVTKAKFSLSVTIK
jgi:hypothetical protein